LKVVFNQDKTGFEDHKDFQIVINEVVAGRYQIVSVLGQAQFSKAVQVLSLEDGQCYCMKIISNNKDYVDQSLDEIKLLKYIGCNGDPEEKSVLRFHDYFYHK
jgi:serine/threonine protein kinase